MMSSSLYASFCPPSQESVAASEAPAAAALEAVVANVNLLISILRFPNDKTTLKTDLSKAEMDQVSRCLIDASQGLSIISQEYRVLSLTVSSMLEDDSKAPSYDLDSLVTPLQFKYAQSSVTSDIEPTADSDIISIGATFPCLEEAEDAFNDYAYRAGFSICKGNSKKDSYQEFACSSRGKVRSRRLPDSIKRRNRASVKKSCKCHVVLRKKGSAWVITTRRLAHSHELMTPEEIQMTAKNRFIPDDVKARAVALYLAGETPAKVQSQLQEEYGGRVTWSMKDLYNMLYRHKATSELTHSA
jgi:hypothetical protein